MRHDYSFFAFVVTLSPVLQCLSTDELTVRFYCETTTSAVLWIVHYDGEVYQIFYNEDSTLNVPETVGPFVFHLNLSVVSADGKSLTLGSVVSVNVTLLRSSNLMVTFTCDGNGDGKGGIDALFYKGIICS